MKEKFFKSEEFFGGLSWCEEDITNAIEIQGYEPSLSNIAKIRKQVENDCFLDYMVECGLNYINNAINSSLKLEEK